VTVAGAIGPSFQAARWRADEDTRRSGGTMAANDTTTPPLLTLLSLILILALVIDFTVVIRAALTAH